MKKLLIILAFACSVQYVSAQQDAMFTHYMFNTQAVNPAYVGSRQALTITGLHRSQWVGFPGAPLTQTLTMHTPIVSQDIGLGLSFINDKIGPINKTSFYADFSYRIRVGKNGGHLAFGLKGGMSLRSAKFGELKATDLGDEAILKNQSSKLLPNFGFGMYYYTERFYAGISAPRLLENDLNTDAAKGLEERHYYLILGGIFNLGEAIKLKPTGFLKVAENAPLEGDITATFLFRDRFWLGGMYRTGDAVGILAGVYITPQLSAGYAFDWSFTNSTFKYNFGTHEVMLRYDFIFKDKFKIKSPRYF